MNTLTTASAVLVRIDVWDDYVCPFCYLGQPLLARIEAEFAGKLEVRSRAFELRPDPEPTLDPDGKYLHDIWSRSVYPMARERRMKLHLPPVQPRSRLAHEMTAFAHARDKGAEVHHALFKAFFEHGQDIGDVDILAKIAASVGLDEAAVRSALAEGTHRAQVLADEKVASGLGIGGVPAISIRAASELVERGVLLKGVQPYETLRGVIDSIVRPDA